VKIASIVLLSLVPSFFAHAADAYEIDGGHSFLVFTVGHMNVSTAHGRFNSFSGEITYDEANPANSEINLTIDMTSVDTGNQRRDDHLRGTDFFSSKQFPEATFETTSVEDKGNGILHVTGDLTMAGQTNPVTVEVKVTGPVEGRGGAILRGFEGKVTFKRSDFGIKYGLGGIGDEVSVTAAIEAKKK